MNNLIQNSYGGVTITLKEITDLIGVRHDKAMIKVETLSKEPSFGVLSKMDITSGENGGRPTTTYVLNKKQAIAVAAKLDNSMLMKVIDRLEELEGKNRVALPSTKELALMVVKAEEEKEALALENKKKSEFISNVVHSENSYTATQIAKDFNISAKLFNKILVEAGVQYYQNGSYSLTARYQSHGLTSIKETSPREDGQTFISLRWTVSGKNWLKKNWENALQKCSRDTFDEYNMQFLKNLPKIPMPKKADRNF